MTPVGRGNGLNTATRAAAGADATRIALAEGTRWRAARIRMETVASQRLPKLVAPLPTRMLAVLPRASRARNENLASEMR